MSSRASAALPSAIAIAPPTSSSWGGSASDAEAESSTGGEEKNLPQTAPPAASEGETRTAPLTSDPAPAPPTSDPERPPVLKGENWWIIEYVRNGIMSSLYDTEAVREVAFHPSLAEKGSSRFRRSMSVIDAEYPVPVEDGSEELVHIGYRLYPFRRRGAPRPVVVHFHGNAETVADMDLLVALFRASGCSVLAVDFRGYGWSTGTPSLCTLTSDAAALVDHLPQILSQAGIEGAPCILAGRSMGSACAIELAARYESSFVGLILESAVSSLLELPVVAEGLGEALASSLPDPFLNREKLARLQHLRVLVLHGLDDLLVPATHAEALYAACGVTAEQKEMHLLDGCSHDDLFEDERLAPLPPPSLHTPPTPASGIA